MRVLFLGYRYGRRAAENVGSRSDFDVEFLEVREPPENVILEEEHARALLPPAYSGFDLVVSYLQHPDLQLALAEVCDAPVLYGIVPDPAVREEIERTHDAVAFPETTMCSLLPETGIPEVDRFAERFGRPELEVSVSGGKIRTVRVVRGAPCGATWVAAERVEGMPAGEEAVNAFALAACHHCAAPRFGKFESKDVAAYLHGVALAEALGIELDVDLEEFELPV
ncbi:DUF166 family protein [Methanopyrus sp.]